MPDGDKRAAPQLTEEDIQLAFCVCSLLDALLKSPSHKYRNFIAVAETTLTRAKEDALKHHNSHLAWMNVEQSSVDPYKIAAWYGFFIAKHADDTNKVSLMATIRLMAHFLGNERGGVNLDKVTCQRLFCHVMNDGVNDDHGIGKNGLYMAFHMAAKVLELSGNPKGAFIANIPRGE